MYRRDAGSHWLACLGLFGALVGVPRPVSAGQEVTQEMVGTADVVVVGDRFDPEPFTDPAPPGCRSCECRRCGAPVSVIHTLAGSPSGRGWTELSPSRFAWLDETAYVLYLPPHAPVDATPANLRAVIDSLTQLGRRVVVARVAYNFTDAAGTRRRGFFELLNDRTFTWRQDGETGDVTSGAANQEHVLALFAAMRDASEDARRSIDRMQSVQWLRDPFDVCDDKPAIRFSGLDPEGRVMVNAFCHLDISLDVVRTVERIVVPPQARTNPEGDRNQRDAIEWAQVLGLRDELVIQARPRPCGDVPGRTPGSPSGWRCET